MLSSPSYAGRSGRPGRAIPRGTLKTPAALTSVSVDVLGNSYYRATVYDKTGGLGVTGHKIKCVLESSSSFSKDLKLIYLILFFLKT